MPPKKEDRCVPRYHLMSGVEEDVSHLLYKYMSLKTLEFDPFFELWKSLGFNWFFSGRTTALEVKSFVRGCYTIGKRFSLPPYTKNERVGALYFLYFVYHNNPLEDPVPIDLTLEEFVEIEIFVDKLKPESKEPAFGFWKMVYDFAFHFVLLPFECTLEKMKEEKMSETIKTKLSSETVVKNKALECLTRVGGIDIEGLQRNLDEYNSCKQMLKKYNLGTNHRLEQWDLKGHLKRQEKPTEDVVIEPRQKHPPRRRRVLTLPKEFMNLFPEIDEFANEDDSEVDDEVISKLFGVAKQPSDPGPSTSQASHSLPPLDSDEESNHSMEIDQEDSQPQPAQTCDLNEFELETDSCSDDNELKQYESDTS